MTAGPLAAPCDNGHTLCGDFELVITRFFLGGGGCGWMIVCQPLDPWLTVPSFMQVSMRHCLICCLQRLQLRMLASCHLVLKRFALASPGCVAAVAAVMACSLSTMPAGAPVQGTLLPLQWTAAMQHTCGALPTPSQ